MPNSPATISTWTTFAPVTLRERKIRSGISGVRGGVLAQDEAREQRERDRAQDQRLRRAPAVARPASTIVYTPSISELVISTAPGTSAPFVEPDALVVLDQPAGQHRGRDADRHVHEEDPVPADRLGEHAAQQQADRGAGGRRRSCRRRSPSPAPAARGTSSRSSRGSPPRSERRRRPAGSARRSASPGSGRSRTARRRAMNSASPAGEHALAPDQVAEPAGQQQQAAERDQVGVHDPREVDCEKPRSSWIDGSATFTIVPSRMIISIPVQST